MAGRRGRATPRTSARSPSACTRTASCGSRGKVGSRVHRRDPAAAARAPRAAGPGRPAVRPGAAEGLPWPVGRRPRRRSRWVRPELVIRAEIGGWTRDGQRPPDRVQGHRAGPRPDGRRPRDRGRHGHRGPCRRGRAPAPERRPRGPPPMPKTTTKTQAPKATAATATPAAATPRSGRHRRRARGPRRPRQGGHLAGRRPRAQADQPRQAAVRRPRHRRPGRPDHEARPHPLLRPHRADDAAAPRTTGRSTSSASRTAPAPRASGRRTSPRRAPKWLTRWHETGVDGREDRDRQRPPPRRRRRRAVLARQPGELRDPRLDRQAARAVAADVRLHRYRSRRQDDLGRDARPRPALPHRARAPRRPRLSQDDRQARHPGLDPDRPRQLRLPRHERVGREGQPGGRRDRPGAHLLGVGEGGPQGPGPARLHPEREHQDARRAVQRPAGGRRARVSAPITWDELDDPDLRPDRWTVRDIIERVAEVGDLFAPAQTDAQELPPV